MRPTLWLWCPTLGEDARFARPFQDLTARDAAMTFTQALANAGHESGIVTARFQCNAPTFTLHLFKDSAGFWACDKHPHRKGKIDLSRLKHGLLTHPIEIMVRRSVLSDKVQS